MSPSNGVIPGNSKMTVTWSLVALPAALSYSSGTFTLGAAVNWIANNKTVDVAVVPTSFMIVKRPEIYLDYFVPKAFPGYFYLLNTFSSHFSTETIH